VAEATAWIGRGDSVDLGLMQVNSANLVSLGMTVGEAFDACASLAAGAAILRAAYGGGQSPAEQQVALLIALSRYNTGSPFKGILNGYARKVIRNARSQPGSEAKVTAQALPPAADPNVPPSWDVWASASYAQSHGAPWLVPLSPGGATKPPQADRLAAHGPAAAARSYAVVASTSAPTERSP
jgi:type IV secretion system protein VirB1